MHSSKESTAVVQDGTTASTAQIETVTIATEPGAPLNASPTLTSQSQPHAPTHTSQEANICAGAWAEAESVLRPLSKTREAAFQLAVIDVLRLILSGDHSLIPGCYSRCKDLEEVAGRDAGEAHKALNAEAEDPRSLLQRVTMQSKFGHPWCEASREVACSSNDAAKRDLKKWRDSVGLLSFAELVKGALTLLDRPLSLIKATKAVLAIRTSWNHCRRVRGIGRGDGDGDEDGMGGDPGEENVTAKLVQGIFMLMLTKIPPHFRTLLKGIGFQADAEAALVLLQEVKGGTSAVCKMFAGALRVLHFLLMSQQEYDRENVKYMAMATSEIDALTKENPTWVLLLWLKSHVYRRQGRLKEAIALLNKTAAVVKEQARKDDQIFSSYRLDFDHGFLLFTMKEFQKSSELIKPLTVRGSLFGAKVLAITVLTASRAFDNDTDDDGRVQRTITQLDELSVIEPTKWGNIDRSIMKKYPTLQARNNKQLLYYELLYLFGHMKSYNPDMAASKRDLALGWLDDKLKGLEQITRQSDIDVDSLETLELTEENRRDVEQFCTAVFLIGATHNAKSNHVKAQEVLEKLLLGLEKNETIVNKCDDPYFFGYARYELGSIHLKRNDLATAKKYLHDANKVAKHGDTASFEHMLRFKCAGALRALKSAEKRTKLLARQSSD